MPIHHAVLALLAEGPGHGYELKTRFEEAIGPQWGRMNIGHFYQVVDRLVRDGLVRGTRIEQDARPDKVRYELTSAGQEELNTWIETPWVRQSGYRDELFLKLFAATRLGRGALATVVAEQRQVYLRELSALGELRRARQDSPLVRLLIDAALLHTQADLSVVERAEDRLGELVDATTGRPAQARSAGNQPARDGRTIA